MHISIRRTVITADPTLDTLTVNGLDGNDTGDFGNVEADSSGKVHVELKMKGVKLTGADSIIGKSIIVHEKEDDLKTDPTGNSGGRFACGVIEAAK